MTYAPARALPLVCVHVRPLLGQELANGNAVSLCHTTDHGTILVMRHRISIPRWSIEPPLVDAGGGEDPWPRREIFCTEHLDWLVCRNPPRTGWIRSPTSWSDDR